MKNFVYLCEAGCNLVRTHGCSRDAAPAAACGVSQLFRRLSQQQCSQPGQPRDDRSAAGPGRPYQGHRQPQESYGPITHS